MHTTRGKYVQREKLVRTFFVRFYFVLIPLNLLFFLIITRLSIGDFYIWLPLLGGCSALIFFEYRKKLLTLKSQEGVHPSWLYFLNVYFPLSSLLTLVAFAFKRVKISEKNIKLIFFINIFILFISLVGSIFSKYPIQVVGQPVLKLAVNYNTYMSDYFEFQDQYQGERCEMFDNYFDCLEDFYRDKGEYTLFESKKLNTVLVSEVLITSFLERGDSGERTLELFREDLNRSVMMVESFGSIRSNWSFLNTASLMSFSFFEHIYLLFFTQQNEREFFINLTRGRIEELAEKSNIKYDLLKELNTLGNN